MNPARLIIDTPLPGAMNMAIDQALLQSVNAAGRPALRFYFWDQPTVSLGYFQPLGSRSAHDSSRDCPCVRRATGGGAIVHDRELTYSICLPSDNRFSANHVQVYTTVHQSLIDALKTFGVTNVRFVGELGSDEHPGESPFLCFQRRTPQDLIIDVNKICGSAQRRLNDALLQHGSVLLAQSSHAPELPGIAEISGQTIPPHELIPVWSSMLSEALALDLHLNELSPQERELSQAIDESRFSSADWTSRR